MRGAMLGNGLRQRFGVWGFASATPGALARGWCTGESGRATSPGSGLMRAGFMGLAISLGSVRLSAARGAGLSRKIDSSRSPGWPRITCVVGTRRIAAESMLMPCAASAHAQVALVSCP